MERLNPLNDYIFMKTFGEKGDEEQLLAFLNAVLKRTGRDGLVSVEIVEGKTLTADIVGDKTCILDVRAHTDKGDHVNIEIQLKDLHNMDRRSVFYWGKQYIKTINAGDSYTVLPNVIAINIVNFDYIPLDDFHTSFHLREDRNTDYILTDAIEIHFINMVQFRKLKSKDAKNNTLERWLLFLDETTPPELVEEADL
jgi:predicted transposase/invertase (TIGR01784 family)